MAGFSEPLEKIMRYITLIDYGRDDGAKADITIPCDEKIFGFLAPEWREIAQCAADDQCGIIHEDERIAYIRNRP
jgi:hypothetical protein